MLPEKQNVVSPDSLDELFHKEARVIEFGSTGEEAAYEKRDAQLITQIRQEPKPDAGISRKCRVVVKLCTATLTRGGRFSAL